MLKGYLLGRKLQTNFLPVQFYPLLKPEISTLSSKTSFFLFLTVNFTCKMPIMSVPTDPFFCCHYVFQTSVISYMGSCRKHLKLVIPSFNSCAALNHSLCQITAPRNTFNGCPEDQALSILAWFSRHWAIWDQCTLLIFPPGRPWWPYVLVTLDITPIPSYVMYIHASVTLFNLFPPPRLLFSFSLPGGSPFIL